MFDYPIIRFRKRDNDSPTGASVARDRAWFRAEYYVWSAKRSWPLGRMDPATGKPYPIMDDDAKRIGRLAYAAAAREAFRQARQHRMPLP